MRNSSVSLGCIHTHSVMWNCRASLGDVPCASQQLSPGSWDANTAERELLPPPQQLTPDNQRGGGGAGSWLLLLPENQWGRGAELAPGSSSRQRPSGEGAELTPGSSSRQRPSGGGSGAGSWILLPPETQWGWGRAGSSSHRRPAGRGRSWLLAPSPARDPVGRERRWLLVLPPAKAHFPSTFRPSDGCHTQEASLMQDRWHLSHSFF